jgi:hypothetical protein
MSSSTLKQGEISRRYAIAIDACGEIAQTYFYLGRVADAQHVLRTMLHLLGAMNNAILGCLKLPDVDCILLE